MNWTSEDYEAVARRLDGEPIDLTADQQALARELAADEAAVGPALDVSLPPAALHHAWARVPPRRPARLTALRWASAAAAVAAAVLVAVMLMLPGDTGRAPIDEVSEKLGPVGTQLPIPVEEYARVLDDDWADRVAELDEDIADAEVDLVLNEDWPFEANLLGFELRINEFLQDNDQPFDPAEPDAWEGAL